MTCVPVLIQSFIINSIQEREGDNMIKREYYKDLNYKPFLFYVIFGVSCDKLQVSASRHHVDGIPDALEIADLNRDEHNDYIEGFFTGTLGKVLRNNNAELFDKCRSERNCVVIRGDVMNDESLDYLRNIIGIGKAFFEQGASGILDMLTFTIFSEEEWTEKFFEKEINAQDHVLIMMSEEDGRYWLHTRGLAEFGRPDLSIYADNKEDCGVCMQILNQMVFYSGQGVFFNGDATLHTHDGHSYKVRAEFVDDFDNDDFNNAYCKIMILERN